MKGSFGSVSETGKEIIGRVVGTGRLTVSGVSTTSARFTEHLGKVKVGYVEVLDTFCMVSRSDF